MRRVLTISIVVILLVAVVGGLFFNQTLLFVALIASMFLMHAFGHGGHGHSSSSHDDSNPGKEGEKKEEYQSHEGHRIDRSREDA